VAISVILCHPFRAI